jgi:hypothetical protein
MIGKARRYSADAGNSLSDTDMVMKSVDDETDRKKRQICIQHFLSENVEEEGHLGDLGVDGKVVTKCVLMK